LSEEGRKLAAVMFTDMVGYSALTQSNESAAMEILERHNRLLRSIFPKFQGREVKTIGDSFLVEFESALDALKCAMELQSYLHDFDESTSEQQRFALRIGIHLGDVIHREGDVFGDAVNIASRIEPLAEPGGICLSEQVYYQVHNKFDLPLLRLGERNLKNVASPVVLYKVGLPWMSIASRHIGSSADKKRIAVLPLRNMSPEPADEYFADGMTDELISAVSNVGELGVISMTSVMGYKNKDKKAAEIARELDVEYLVEGSIRKTGNRIRISVQLIEAGSDNHVWSSRYDKELDDIFEIQSDIASRVASELRIKLVDSERRRLTKKPTESTEAYAFFLRGKELHAHADSESLLRQALDLFEKAVQIDPGFAEAHAETAFAWIALASRGWEPMDKSIAAAEASAKKALELDPDLAEAHVYMGYVHSFRNELRQEEAEELKALELNPSLPEAYNALSDVLVYKGEIDEAYKVAENFYLLDPINPHYVGFMGMMLFYQGKEREALEHWSKTMELAPFPNHLFMTEYFLSKNDLVKAEEHYAAAKALEPSYPTVLWLGGYIAAKKGDRDEALRVIRRMEEASRGPVTYNFVALVRYALGDLDSYFGSINRAFDLGAFDFLRPVLCPLFGEARADPRYQSLIERMKAAYWSKKA
jgi:adenylate cyclase